MSVYRGMDGSVTFNAVALGNARVVGVNTTRGLIDVTVKGDKLAQRQGGLVIHTLTFAGVLDYVTGQKTLIDYLEAATPDLSLQTLVFTVATGKTWTWTTGALLEGYQVSSPEGDNPVTVDFTFHLNVPAVISWV
ncbi:MAG TPA: hypothetical protein VF910_00940 [Candidatus Bathyarchaeia archaeon]